MSLLLHPWIGVAAVYGPLIVSAALVTLSIAAYLVLRPGDRLRKAALWLLLGGVIARLVLALTMSVAQYQAWATSELGKLLLPGHQGWGYFLGYVGDRYWLGLGLALLCAGLWYGFLRAIRSHSERYFDVGEIELTTVLVFAIGWPGALVLVPLALVSVVAVSLARMLILKKELTTLGVPFLVASVITLVVGEAIRKLFVS